MASELGFWDRLFMPFYKPEKIASRLVVTTPKFAAEQLEGMRPAKGARVLSFWSEKVQALIMNQMGNYSLRLLKLMDPADQARLFVRLRKELIYKFSAGLSDKVLSRMMSNWSDGERIVVFNKLPAETSIKLFRSMKSEEQIEFIENFKPWIQSYFLEGMPAKDKARFLEKFGLKRAVDLLTRWSAIAQSEVLQELTEERRTEIINALGHRAIPSIIVNWPDDEIIEHVLLLSKDKLVYVVGELPEEIRFKIFKVLPVSHQRLLLDTFSPQQASRLLREIPKKEAEKLLNQLKASRAEAIRRKMLTDS